MSETSLHPMYSHYSELPYSLRVLYTAALLVLGLGYLFALTYLFHVDSAKDGDPSSLSYEDVVITYSGTGKGTRLESALRGPMRSMLPTDEIDTLISWTQQGADRATYESQIKPIVDKRCLACHDGSNPHLANIKGYDNIQKVIERDTGTGIFTLVRLSHVHLFGLTFVFFVMGIIFSHAYVRPVWLKCTAVALPFVCLVLDVSSWYFTKLYHPFALVVMGAGAGMGASFAYMWVVSMYQLWFSGTPAAVARRARDADVG
ncbi:MAG: elongation factor-1 alpha [Betaproteobacteria bacterium]|nr:elongation factor-1 alpha [Betaproteobacteria bacterium]MDH3436893.1 elongation factor-1 alpha [Betaproteobacteria bacterium]